MATSPKTVDYAAYFREMNVMHDMVTPQHEMDWIGSTEKDPEPHKVVLCLGCNVLRTSHLIRRNAIDPFLDDLAEPNGPLIETYEPGTWGPTAADALLAAHGHAWASVCVHA